jgi:hypothetical protein
MLASLTFGCRVMRSQGAIEQSNIVATAHHAQDFKHPLIQIMIEVCNYAKGGSLFQSGCQGIQAVVDHVTEALPPCAPVLYGAESSIATKGSYWH